MPRELVEMTINEDGSVEFEIKGVHGKGCVTIADGLSAALGVETDRRFTQEAYKQPARAKQKVGGKTR